MSSDCRLMWVVCACFILVAPLSCGGSKDGISLDEKYSEAILGDWNYSLENGDDKIGLIVTGIISYRSEGISHWNSEFMYYNSKTGKTVYDVKIESHWKIEKGFLKESPIKAETVRNYGKTEDASVFDKLSMEDTIHTLPASTVEILKISSSELVVRHEDGVENTLSRKK